MISFMMAGCSTTSIIKQAPVHNTPCDPETSIVSAADLSCSNQVLNNLHALEDKTHDNRYKWVQWEKEKIAMQMIAIRLGVKIEDPHEEAIYAKSALQILSKASPSLKEILTNFLEKNNITIEKLERLKFQSEFLKLEHVKKSCGEEYLLNEVPVTQESLEQQSLINEALQEAYEDPKPILVKDACGVNRHIIGQIPSPLINS